MTAHDSNTDLAVDTSPHPKAQLTYCQTIVDREQTSDIVFRY